MPPLTRQDTYPPSIYSWWSDSNPALQGPTINLHAVAKPLLKRMYHRQALQFIKKNRDSPLSKATLEIYASYFPWDWISSRTKEAILEELIPRSKYEAEARAMVNSPVLHDATRLLGLPDVGARISACKLLTSLAKFEYARPAILELKPCEQLVSFRRSDKDEITTSALCLLAQIAQTSDGAQAVVDSKALNDVLVELKWYSGEVQYWTCELVGLLAGHASTAPTVLELNPCPQLLTLAGENNHGTTNFWNVPNGRAADIYALSQIARWPDGAQAIVDAGALDLVMELLDSARSNAQRWPWILSASLDNQKWTCELVGVLASHDSTAPALSEFKLCWQLTSLLYDANFEVISPAVHALSQISRWRDGAQAIVYAGALDLVLELLESPSPTTRKWTCQLVGNIASHQSTSGAVLALKPSQTLVTLFSDEDSEVVDGAAYALSQIARLLAGAQAIVDAGALGHISELLESPSSTVRKWTCLLVGNLASRQSTSPACAVLALRPYKQLVTLLRDDDFGVDGWAAYALSKIAHLVDGAQAIVDAKTLDHVPTLLQSPSPNIRKWTCELVAKLASHELTLPAILELEPSEQLVSCLREPATRASTISALCEISKWLDGVATLTDLDVAEELQELIELPDTTTDSVQEIRTITDNISRYIEGIGIAL